LLLRHVEMLAKLGLAQAALEPPLSDVPADLRVNSMWSFQHNFRPTRPSPRTGCMGSIASLGSGAPTLEQAGR
jgi:hypothetical protein